MPPAHSLRPQDASDVAAEHLAHDEASYRSVPNGRGVLVKVLRVGVDDTDKEINAAGFSRLDTPFLEPGGNLNQLIVNKTPYRRKHSARRWVNEVENILRPRPFPQHSFDKPLF